MPLVYHKLQSSISSAIRSVPSILKGHPQDFFHRCCPFDDLSDAALSESCHAKQYRLLLQIAVDTFRSTRSCSSFFMGMTS